MVAAISSNLTTASIIHISANERRFIESQVLFSLGHRLVVAAAEDPLKA